MGTVSTTPDLNLDNDISGTTFDNNLFNHFYSLAKLPGWYETRNLEAKKESLFQKIVKAVYVKPDIFDYFFKGISYEKHIQKVLFERKIRENIERVHKLYANNTFEKAPNKEVYELANRTLELLRKKTILPSLINATGDESILFEFFVESDKYSIEFYNSGEIIFIERRKNKQVRVIEIGEHELAKAVEKIALAYDNRKM